MEILVMKIGQHIEEDDLERYSMGAMSEEEAAPFEEHLLICEACRCQLETCDEYIVAVKSATAELSRSAAVPKATAPASGSRTFRASWVLALASVALAFVLAREGNFLHAPAPREITLLAMRGALPGAQAKAGERLALSPDLTGLPALPSYRMEVVDAIGRPVARAEWKHSPLITPRLAAGMYFVRISSPAGELLREYGLAVGKATTSN
jgi:anti-sigma factor RsiW